MIIYITIDQDEQMLILINNAINIRHYSGTCIIWCAIGTRTDLCINLIESCELLLQVMCIVCKDESTFVRSKNKNIQNAETESSIFALEC